MDLDEAREIVNGRRPSTPAQWRAAYVAVQHRNIWGGGDRMDLLADDADVVEVEKVEPEEPEESAEGDESEAAE